MNENSWIGKFTVYVKYCAAWRRVWKKNVNLRFCIANKEATSTWHLKVSDDRHVFKSLTITARRLILDVRIWRTSDLRTERVKYV